MCESLSMKAEVYISQYDLQSAKHMFIKAWKLKCPDETERKTIEKKLKIGMELEIIFLMQFVYGLLINK